MWVYSNLACRRKSSNQRWANPPSPVVPTVNFPGLACAHATISGRFLNGAKFDPANALKFHAETATGAKSLMVS